MDEIDRRLINLLQEGIPVEEYPFRAAADELGIGTQELLGRIQVLLDNRILSRFGPLYNAEHMGGMLSLCAMCVEPERFDAVAEQVNAWPEVAHNYEREHSLNMWFVVASESPEQYRHVIAGIERETGCRVFEMPKQQEYFLDLRLQA